MADNTPTDRESTDTEPTRRDVLAATATAAGAAALPVAADAADEPDTAALDDVTPGHDGGRWTRELTTMHGVELPDVALPSDPVRKPGRLNVSSVTDSVSLSLLAKNGDSYAQNLAHLSTGKATTLADALYNRTPMTVDAEGWASFEFPDHFIIREGPGPDNTDAVTIELSPMGGGGTMLILESPGLPAVTVMGALAAEDRRPFAAALTHAAATVRTSE